VGGQTVSQVFEGEKRFDMTVRWLAPYRNDVSRLKEILIATPGGAQVPLGTLAEVKLEEGPALVYREANHRYVPVKFSVRGRDLAGTVNEAQQRVAELHLPYDVHLEWSGEINELKQATRRLTIIVPLTLLLITLLVYAAVRRWQDTVVVLCNIPIASCGGVLALLATGIDFSISAAMGFISVFGIAVQDGILVVSYTQRLLEQGLPLEQAILDASQRRLRPVLMTTLVAMLGLTPAALSNAIGSQTQKPLAVVVIGGAMMLIILPRLAIPSLLLLFHRRMDRSKPAAPSPSPQPATA
jgi:cobalt-zinc-cadmium resistance protein CzcA